MPPLISLIPQSGIQFWNTPLDMDSLPRQARQFWEQPLSEGMGGGLVAAD